jgi:hypothetical protein
MLPKHCERKVKPTYYTKLDEFRFLKGQKKTKVDDKQVLKGNVTYQINEQTQKNLSIRTNLSLILMSTCCCIGIIQQACDIVIQK